MDDGLSWVCICSKYLYAHLRIACSGKSTLLNTLTCRLNMNTIVSSEMCLNDSSPDNSELKRIFVYVMHYETLIYIAELRLPWKLINEERKKRIDEVMTEL